MKTAYVIVALILIVILAVATYQIGSLYLANVEFTADLRDLSSLAGTRIGLVVPRTVDEIRDQVVEHAAEHGIHLDPEQVNVERNGQGKNGNIFISTAYDSGIDLFGLKLKFHFTAASPHNLDCPLESRDC